MRFLKLLQKNREVDPATYEAVYGSMVEKEFRKRYSQSKTEAIVNNYIAEPNNPVYVKEMNDMQSYRKQCKVNAKKRLGVE